MNTDELLIPEEYRKEIRHIRAELEELDAKKKTLQGHGFDSPESRSSRRSGAYFEDVIMKYNETYSQLITVTAEYVIAKDRLFHKIERLESQNYKDLLYYRYVSGYSIKKIKSIYGCADRWVYRMLQQAKEEYERMNEDENTGKL